MVVNDSHCNYNEPDVHLLHDFIVFVIDCIIYFPGFFPLLKLVCFICIKLIIAYSGPKNKINIKFCLFCYLLLYPIFFYTFMCAIVTICCYLLLASNLWKMPELTSLWILMVELFFTTCMVLFVFIGLQLLPVTS